MKQPQKRAQILLAVALLLYACGYVTQFIGNYAVWQKNGGMLGGTSPPFPSLSPLTCLKGVLWFPYNLYCMAGCAAAVAVIFLYRKLFSQDALTDSERNFDFSAKGTYGTSGWMQTREVPAVLDMVSDLSQHTGTVLGMLDGKFLCIPEKTRMNGNLAVYGASGSMKTRSFCMNRILQSAARGESLIICDPKSELYEKSSEYMRDLGYTVRVFNLVSPENSDSWNCLKEIEGQELMAQLFVDVIIKNTNGTGKSDRFWDSGEMNLLKALVLYVDLTYPPEQRTIGEVYNLITQCSESQLDSLFDVLPLTHPAKAPYSLYQRASDSVRSGVISGLGSRLQVFQSDLIKKITAYDEISLELPGQQHCAYYLVTSDQDSTFDFLASLFLSFAFIKLVRYADANCPGGRLPVPVHVLGEELTACGTISELSRRISVIRSRNISMSCVFQNLAGLQNRYPQNQWQEILGNCDVQLFLGCTDQLTAEYVSQRTGIASVAVSSTSKALSTLRVSDYTPQYRESSGVGKRSVLTPDEVLRLPVDEALVILRGHKVLKVRKMDYSLHPAYKQLRECKASTMQLIARRMRLAGTPVYIIAPLKGHEFYRQAKALNGTIIRIVPGSPDCINVMEIRKIDHTSSELLDGPMPEQSELAAKIQKLHIFFSLLIPDLSNEERQLLDEAIVTTYRNKGITYDNASLDDPAHPGQYREMPILGDLHTVLSAAPETRRIANILNRLVHGSASSFNRQTNVNLDNSYVVIDISELSGDLLTVGMYIGLDYMWDKAKEDLTRRKQIFIDEVWQIIGASSNALAANYVFEAVKTIRGYGGGVLVATQDLNDFFSLEDGKYGRGILNNCKIKIILNLEEEEAQRVQSVLKLTDAEIDNITRFERGSALIVTNSNNVTVDMRCSEEEKDLITTDRDELRRIVERKMQNQPETEES